MTANDKTILCYGDSNSFGRPPMRDLDDFGRFGPNERWSGVLRVELGDGYHIVEEGHSGRTTVHADPVEGEHKNGLAILPAILETHMPLHTVVLMLGTNDLKARFGVSALEISQSINRLVRTIAASGTGPNFGSPSILLICPPPIFERSFLTEMFRGGAEKSKNLAPFYRGVADRSGIGFLDAGEIIDSDTIDGIHLSVESHGTLGAAVADKLRTR